MRFALFYLPPCGEWYLHSHKLYDSREVALEKALKFLPPGSIVSVQPVDIELLYDQATTLAEPRKIETMEDFVAMDREHELIQPEEFRRAFEENIMADEQVAYTNANQPYPGFVNIAAVDEGTIQITVRGDVPEDCQNAGPQARICIPLEEWQQLVASANRLRFPGKGKDEHAEHADAGDGAAPVPGTPAEPTGDAAEEGGDAAPSIVDEGGKFAGDPWPGA